MKRLLLRLYPTRWRERYGDEFESVLAARPLGPSDVADVVHGAVDARLRDSGAIFRRSSGYAAIGGGLLWPIGLFACMFDASGRPWAINTAFGEVPFPQPWAISMTVGGLLLIAAFVGLSSSRTSRHPRLVWGSAIVAALGTGVTLWAVGALQLVHPISLQEAMAVEQAWVTLDAAFPLMIGGSALFAVATWYAGIVSRPAALILLGGSCLMFVTLIGGTWPVTKDLMKASWYLGFFYVALAVYAVGWVSLGVSPIRSRPGSSDPTDEAVIEHG